MSDNLLLTLIGAVGIGALVMGMNKDDELREDWWGGIHFSATRETVKRHTDKNGCVTESVVNPKDTNITTQQSLKRLQKEQARNLQAKMAANSKLAFGNGVKSNEGYDPEYPIQENFEQDRDQQYHLGSNQVTGDYYASFPNYQQSVTQPSPSLGLPAHIRYNPPSLDKMGITENFQNRNGDVVEGYMSTFDQNPTPAADYTSGNYKKVVAEAIDDSGVKLKSQLQVGTMEDNTIIYDRYITVPGKAAGRFNRGNGIVDRIRGDLPVCVDPCQKGWFSSPGKPSDLTIGALSYIGGESTASNELTNFVQMNGGTPSIKQSTDGGNAVTNLLANTSPSTGDLLYSAYI
jgi:hypothetical protein